MNYLEQITLFLSSHKIESTSVATFIVFILALFFLKRHTIVKKLVLEVINESKEFLNSEIGQSRIDFVETKLQEKVKLLPLYMRLFIGKLITKHYIVTVIENVLNQIQDVFDETAEDIDIKGNEEISQNQNKK